jgi:hypothetical protein
MDDDKDDDRIDRLVRAASVRPVNEALLSRTVLARVRGDAHPAESPLARLFAFPEFSGPGRLVPAGFALVLLAMPFAVARYPGDPADRAIYAFALGDPAMIAFDEGTLFRTDLFE